MISHYLADWQARTHKLDMSVEQCNKLIDAFDVSGSKIKIDRTQIHELNFLGQTWGSGSRRFTADDAIRYTANVRRFRGGVTRDVSWN